MHQIYVRTQGGHKPAFEISEGCRTEQFSEGFRLAEKQKFLKVTLDL